MFIGELQKMTRFDRIYCPNQCGHSYMGTSRKKNLRRHMMFDCGIEPQFQCPLCSKRFSQKCGMKLHGLRIHQINLI